MGKQLDDISCGPGMVFRFQCRNYPNLSLLKSPIDESPARLQLQLKSPSSHILSCTLIMPDTITVLPWQYCPSVVMA